MRTLALQMINEGLMLTRAGYRILLGEGDTPASTDFLFEDSVVYEFEDSVQFEFEDA
jgi:hypothetical protein